MARSIWQMCLQNDVNSSCSNGSTQVASHNWSLFLRTTHLGRQVYLISQFRSRRWQGSRHLPFGKCLLASPHGSHSYAQELMNYLWAKRGKGNRRLCVRFLLQVRGYKVLYFVCVPKRPYTIREINCAHLFLTLCAAHVVDLKLATEYENHKDGQALQMWVILTTTIIDPLFHREPTYQIISLT